ncbi:MAG: shikimate kinase [bacterium]|nr:shikimate kinase [bacterium]
MNITLIGMAGAGKSYIGRPLAERLELEFIDIDKLLESAYGKPIQSILDELGATKYVETESEMLIQGTSGRDNLVISPGGSIIYRDRAMDHTKDISTLVYLKVPFETIEARLKGASPRAIIGLGQKSLQELYDERTPLYELHADIIVDTAPRTLGEVLEEIIRLLPDTMSRNG